MIGRSYESVDVKLFSGLMITFWVISSAVVDA